MSHGGRRKGAGGPVTTGSSLRPVVSFRLGVEDYDRAALAAGGRGVSVNVYARTIFTNWINAKPRSRR